jgi:O-antigen/teichoic acid export membrane protein
MSHSPIRANVHQPAPRSDPTSDRHLRFGDDPSGKGFGELGQKAVSGLKWQFAQTFGRQAIAFGVSLVLARLLGPDSFGMMSMVNLYIAFVTIFVQQGVSSALIQRRDVAPAHLSTAFWFGIGCATVACLITAIASPIVASLFAQPRLVPLILAASLGLLISAVGGVHEALFLRQLDFRRPAVRLLVATLLGGATGISMAISGFGVWSLIGLHLGTSLASTALLWSLSTWRPRLMFSWAHLRDLLGLSSSLFSSSLLWFFASRADHFFIGRFLGSAELGVYSVAGRLPELLRTSIGGPIGRVALPILSRLQESPAKQREVVENTMNVLALTGFPIFLGLAALAPTAVPVFFGSKWILAIEPLQALCLFSLTCYLHLLIHPLMIALALGRQYLVIGILNATLVTLSCATTVQFGTTWLVLTMVMSLNIVGLLSFRAISRKLKLPISAFLTPTIRPCMMALAMSGAVFAMNGLSSGLLLLLGQLVVGILTFGVLIYSFGRRSLNQAYTFCLRSRPKEQSILREWLT